MATKIKKGILVYVDVSHMTGIVIPRKSKVIIKRCQKIEKRYKDDMDAYEIAIQHFINKYDGIELERVFTMNTPKIIYYDSDNMVEVRN